ncbi:MAG: hypothetical protein J5759_04010 [Bacteroidales bacterium]|nr:hypothetical protein [Bacteroidales bacterium]
MKSLKYILLTLIYALALTACVKEVVNMSSQGPGIVTFMPATYRVATKTPDGSVFSTANSFGCYAFSSPDGTEDSWGTYMHNQEISYNTTSSAWLPTLDYYWPHINKVSFLSYAPYSATDPWVTSATPRSIKAENQTPGADDDWLYADLAADYNDYLVPVDPPGAPHSFETDDISDGESGFSGVPTLFRHALARVSFRVKASRIISGSSGTIVNAEDEKIEDQTYTEWVTDTDASTSFIEGDNGTDAVRTVIEVKHRTETLSMSQTTIVTEIDTPTSWDIKVSSISFKDLVATGTMELIAEAHTFGTPARVPMSGGWRLADGASLVSVDLPNALGNNSLTTDYQPLLAERTVIPQSLDYLSLNIKYTSTVTATHATITTNVTTWDRVKVYTQTHVTKTNILNGKVVSDDTDETLDSVTDGTKTTTPTVETTPTDASFTVNYDKWIGLKQSGLTEWPMNRKITYSIIIEPDGKRITWDPAEVEDWGIYNHNTIAIE